MLGRFLFLEDKVLGDSDSEDPQGSLFPREPKEVKRGQGEEAEEMGECLQGRVLSKYIFYIYIVLYLTLVRA